MNIHFGLDRRFRTTDTIALRCYPKRFAGTILILPLLILSLGNAALASEPGDDDRLSSSPAYLSQSDEAEYVPDEILVGFMPGAKSSDVRSARSAVKAKNIKSFDVIRVQQWKLPPGLEPEKAMEIVMRRPGVLYAEPNYFLHTTVEANDPLLTDLWGLHNVGQSGGTADADIDAPEAWEIRTDADAEGLVVGVIDTGIDFDHEDLQGNLWVNEAEMAGDPGQDDDGNGYVDDFHGWNFVNDDNDPMDDRGHGTHVSGTICGNGNNGVGVAGVAWSCKLAALKFLDAGGRGTTDDAIEAVLYAARMGFPVTNNSWGGGKRSKALLDAINSLDGIFVASAGNRGTSRVQYPAGYSAENIISVAATDHNDELASFSNYSASWVDLAAPGVDTLSTVPGDEYDVKSGTSMAAPHVTGAVALLIAEEPTLSFAEIKARILGTVDQVPALAGNTATGGRLNLNRALGGSDNPASDTLAPGAVVMTLLADQSTFDSLTLQWIAPSDDDGVPDSGPVYAYDLRYREDGPIDENNWDSSNSAQDEPVPAAPGTTETTTVNGLAANTAYHFALKSIDEAENTSAVSSSVAGTTLTSPWIIRTIDDGHMSGFYLGAAIDPDDGKAAMAYGHIPDDTVRFAKWNGTAWTREVIDDGHPGVALAFNPVTGHPAVSHGWGKLRFLQFDGMDWNLEVLVNKNAFNDVTSLAFDSGGNPCIAYRVKIGGGKNASSNFNLTCNYGSGWETRVIETDDGAKYKSLVFDSNDYPIVAYSGDSDDDGYIDALKLAYWNGVGWDYDIVESGVRGAGVFASLVLDPADGSPLIVDRADGKVRFHFMDATGAWQKTVVDDGNDTNIAIAEAGMPYISYGSADPDAVMVARPAVAGDYAQWEFLTVENVPIWYRTAIVINGSGQPVVGYSDQTGDDALRAAERIDP